MIDEALTDNDWIIAMEEELHQFTISSDVDEQLFF